MANGQANFLPLQPRLETPQVTVPLSQSPSSLSAIGLPKRKPGRPPKLKLAPTVTQAGLPGSIPTQSDGEGSVVKKRKVVSETSDQAIKLSEEITIAEPLKTKESPPRTGQNQVSQHEDARTVSPANSVQGHKMSESACRTLETEPCLRSKDDLGEGENQLLLEAKVSGSVKHVSRILNEPLESQNEKKLTSLGQTVEGEPTQGTEKVTKASELRNGEESVGIPPADVNIKQRPVRKKRKLVGGIQRFADETTEEPGSGNSAAVKGTTKSKVGKINALPKNLKPRGPGRPKKILSGIGGQGRPAAENIQGKTLGQTTSGMQSSQLQDCLEKQPRRRGRPKKAVPVMYAGVDPKEAVHGTRSSEGDLEKQESQIHNPQENLPTEREENRHKNDNNGKIIEPTLQDIHHSPRLDGSLDTQKVKLHGDPPLGTKAQPRKGSPSLDEVIHPSNKPSNAGLDQSGLGMHSIEYSQSKAQKRTSKKSRIQRAQREVNGPRGTSYTSRLHGSVHHSQIVDPCDNLPGTKGLSAKVSTIQGQTSYSPGNFYSALLGESDCNTKTANPLKNTFSRFQEQADRVSPPRSDVDRSTGNSYHARTSEREHGADPSQIGSSIGSPFGNSSSSIDVGQLRKFRLPVGKEIGRTTVPSRNNTVIQTRLALPHRNTKEKSSEKMDDPQRVVVSASKGIENEMAFHRMEICDDELNTQPPQIPDRLTDLIYQSEAHAETQKLALQEYQSNNPEPPPREGRHPQAQILGKKRVVRKKKDKPDLGLPFNTESTEKESNAEYRIASPKSSNSVSISVYELSRDQDARGTATTDPVVCINDKYIAAADIMAQICQEFAMKSHASAYHSVQSRLSHPAKTGLKRRLEISRDGGGTLDACIFQLV